MTERARREYAEALRPRYAQADKRERGRMLDEYCRATGSHRKAAIRCLRRQGGHARRAPGRPRRYGPEVVPMRERVWRASDRLCGKLLAPVLPTYLQALEQHHGVIVPAAIRRALESASPATLERLLRPLRRQRRRQPYRASPAVAALRQQIPLRTWDQWTAVAPGAMQGDLVLHCGESTGGCYLATLLAIDVATSWTEFDIVWGVGQQRVGTAVHHIRQRLPVPLREWHSDNGGEFLNDALVAWCRREPSASRGDAPIARTIRRGLSSATASSAGSSAMTATAAGQPISVFQRLYGLLRLQFNFFRPVRKLLTKRRVGSKVHKRYDAARTPYQRLVAAGVLTAAQHQALERQRETLDPISLARDIERTLDTLWKLADTRPAAAEAARG